jgi:putative transposase
MFLDEIVQTRRNTKAARPAEPFYEEAGMSPETHRHRQASLLWCGPAAVDATIEHRSHKGLNNRAANSHLPLRKRERVMQRFRPPGGLQRFVNVFSAVRNLIVPARSRQSLSPFICIASRR